MITQLLTNLLPKKTDWKEFQDATGADYDRFFAHLTLNDLELMVLQEVGQLPDAKTVKDLEYRTSVIALTLLHIAHKYGFDLMAAMQETHRVGLEIVEGRTTADKAFKDHGINNG